LLLLSKMPQKFLWSETTARLAGTTGKITNHYVLLTIFRIASKVLNFSHGYSEVIERRLERF